MSLPGAVEVQDQVNIVLEGKALRIPNDISIGDAVIDGIRPGTQETIAADKHVLDLSQEEVLNFDLQTEPTTSPPECQSIINVSVGERQQTPTVIPSNFTNQPTATNYTSSPEDHSQHANDSCEDNSDAHIVLSTNISKDTNIDDIEALRLRLNSENQISQRWQSKGPISRSTVSVDRNFGTYPRNFQRRFGGSEDRDIPPHPLNTYQWEDVRRSREKVIWITHFGVVLFALLFCLFHTELIYANQIFVKLIFVCVFSILGRISMDLFGSVTVEDETTN